MIDADKIDINKIDIDKLSREQRLDLMERIWDSLEETDPLDELSDAQRAELDRRLDELDREGPVGKPAEEVLSRLRGRNE